MMKNDCLVCLVKPSINFFLIVMPIKSECPHKMPKSKRQHYRTHTKLFQVSYSILFLSVLCTLVYCYQITRQCQKATLQCFILCQETIFCLNGMIIHVVAIIKTNARIRDLNGWISIFQNTKKFGNNIHFSQMFVKTFHKYIYLYIAIITSVLTGFTVGNFIIDDNMDFKILRQIPVIFSFYIQLTIVLKFSVLINFVNKIYSDLKQELNNTIILHTSNDNKIVPVYRKEFDTLEGKLRQLHKYVLALSRNFLLIAEFYQAKCVFWLWMSILNLIFNIFMIITQWDKVTNYIIILQLRTFGTMVSIVYLMFRAQNVQNVVSVTYNF